MKLVANTSTRPTMDWKKLILTRWIVDNGGTDPAFYTNPGWWPLILVLLKLWQGAGYGTMCPWR